MSPRKLTDLRACDNCTGPVGHIFYVVRVSHAVVNQRAVQEMAGMHQFFGGRAGLGLIENFAPAMANGFTVAMDEPEFKELMSEAFVCNVCYMEKPLDMALLFERIHERKRRESERAATAADDKR